MRIQIDVERKRKRERQTRKQIDETDENTKHATDRASKQPLPGGSRDTRVLAVQSGHDGIVHSNAKKVLCAFPQDGRDQTLLQAAKALVGVNFAYCSEAAGIDARLWIQFTRISALQLDPDSVIIGGKGKRENHTRTYFAVSKGLVRTTAVAGASPEMKKDSIPSTRRGRPWVFG